MIRTITVLALLGGLAACGDPLRDVGRLSDVDLAESGSVAIAETAAPEREGGLFARLLNRSPEDPTNAAVEAALADVQGVGGADPVEEVTPPVEAALEPQRERRGLLGLFGRNRSDADAAPTQEVATDEAPVATENATEGTAEDGLVTASAESTAAPEPEPQRRRGLFGRRAAQPDRYEGPDVQIVEAGTQLPFGQIARVCDLPRNRRGTEIERLGPIRLHDTIPNATAPRPHYLTGFDDDCARTFTAAVVIPSDVATHEFIRYDANSDRPYSQVDNAYEAIKASVCRVGRGRPCGARIDRLERDMQFMTVYRSFGSGNDVWGEILIYQGRVVAMDVAGG